MRRGPVRAVAVAVAVAARILVIQQRSVNCDTPNEWGLAKHTFLHHMDNQPQTSKDHPQYAPHQQAEDKKLRAFRGTAR